MIKINLFKPGFGGFTIIKRWLHAFIPPLPTLDQNIS